MRLVGQLALDGAEVTSAPRARGLTDRQRDVLRFVRVHGVITATQAGRIMHASRDVGICKGVQVGRCCGYASTDGSAALQRLARRGLVVRTRRGVYVARVHDEQWAFTA